MKSCSTQLLKAGALVADLAADVHTDDGLKLSFAAPDTFAAAAPGPPQPLRAGALVAGLAGGSHS